MGRRSLDERTAPGQCSGWRLIPCNWDRTLSSYYLRQLKAKLGSAAATG